MSAENSINVDQRSRIGSFVWMGFYTALLSIPTLTLFRFWGRTQMRRRLWADTLVDGEPLEYTGKGSELFIGFLIGIVTVSLPLAVALLAVQVLVGSPPLLIAIVLLIYIGLFLLIGTAVYLARRYQLSRTLWRGVRFSQSGSPLGYGTATLGYLFLTFITLGWYAPVMRLRLARRMWSEASFGDTPFVWDESRRSSSDPVWTSFALSWFGSLIPLVALGISSAAGADMAASTDPTGFIVLIYLVLFLSLPPALLLGAWHEAVMQRRIARCLSVGDLKLSSAMSAKDQLSLIFGNIALVILTLGFGGMPAQMRVWRKSALRLRTEGALDYSKISQASSKGPASGEGMADALDLGGAF